VKLAGNHFYCLSADRVIETSAETMNTSGRAQSSSSAITRYVREQRTMTKVDQRHPVAKITVVCDSC
jgi:hypothetical protein